MAEDRVAEIDVPTCIAVVDDGIVAGIVVSGGAVEEDEDVASAGVDASEG